MTSTSNFGISQAWPCGCAISVVQGATASLTSPGSTSTEPKRFPFHGRTRRVLPVRLVRVFYRLLPGQAGADRNAFEYHAAQAGRRETVGGNFTNRAAEAGAAGRESVDVPFLVFVGRAEEEVGGDISQRPLKLQAGLQLVDAHLRDC